MDQELKQRIVGAVVITSLAAIFIPMLFDDPIDQTGKTIVKLKIPKAPDKIFESIQTKLPNYAEDVINRPKPQVLQKVAEKKIITNTQRWIIQLGTFGNKDNALTLQKKIRAQGFSVSIKEIIKDKTRLYRVIVGPEQDKAKAENIKARIDKINETKSILSLVKN